MPANHWAVERWRGEGEGETMWRGLSQVGRTTRQASDQTSAVDSDVIQFRSRLASRPTRTGARSGDRWPCCTTTTWVVETPADLTRCRSRRRSTAVWDATSRVVLAGCNESQWKCERIDNSVRTVADDRLLTAAYQLTVQLLNLAFNLLVQVTSATMLTVRKEQWRHAYLYAHKCITCTASDVTVTSPTNKRS